MVTPSNELCPEPSFFFLLMDFSLGTMTGPRAGRGGRGKVWGEFSEGAGRGGRGKVWGEFSEGAESVAIGGRERAAWADL